MRSAITGVALFACLLFASLSPGQDATPVPTLPNGWQALPDKELVAALKAYFEAAPNLEQGRPVVIDVWNDIFANDERIGAMASADVLDLMRIMTRRVTWMRNPDGSYPDGGNVEDYLSRLATLRTQQQQKFEASGGDVGDYTFDAIWQLWSSRSTQGTSEEQKQRAIRAANAAAQWMAATDWTQLTALQKVLLLRIVGSDLLDSSSFSVRWKGQLAAPVTGEYRLGWLLNSVVNGECRILVNGEVIFDSKVTSPLSFPSERVLLTEPVHLDAGRPSALVVEYRYDSSNLIPEAPEDGRSRNLFPMMVLMWESDSMGLNVIPDEAFSTQPSGSTQLQPGVQEEFFSDSSLQTSAVTRISSNVAKIWPQSTPFLPIKAELVTAIVDDLMAGLSVTDTAGSLTLSHGLLLYCNCQQRQQILELLLADLEPLAANANFNLLNWGDLIAMLPGDARLRMLTGWVEAREALNASVPNSAHINHNDCGEQAYWLIGHYQQDLNQLLENGLETPDGQPRLEMIAIVAHAVYLQQRSRELQDYIDAKYEQPLAGDQLAQWLMARAWMKEAFCAKVSREPYGLNDFQEAAEVAVNPRIRLEALREVMIREIVLGKSEQALARINDASNTPAEGLADAVVAVKAEMEVLSQNLAPMGEFNLAEQRSTAIGNQRAALQSRIEKAQARGDAVSAQRYQQQLEQIPAQ